MSIATPGCPPAAPDARSLRQALGRFATGVTVITTRRPDGGHEGLTANSFASVSLDPPLILWSLRREAASLPGFLAAGRFAVHVLSARQAGLSRQFATAAADKFAGVDWLPGLGGCPLLPGTLACLECQTETTHAAGDHVIFIGRVERLAWDDGVPLLYSGGRYGIAAALEEAA